MKIFKKDSTEELDTEVILEAQTDLVEEDEVVVEAPEKTDLEVKAADIVEEPKVETKSSSHVDEVGIISKATVVHGDIKTGGHLAVAGIVEGSVSCAGNLMLTGEIKGTIDCNNIVIDNIGGASVLKVKESVSVKEHASFTGDIGCKNISIMGKVAGNISASGNVGITKTAVIEGDITAHVIAIEPGAKVKGYINIE